MNTARAVAATMTTTMKWLTLVTAALGLFGVFGALAGCDGAGGSSDAGALDAEVPAACAGCAADCCRLANDAGFACMNYDHRNAVTMECTCGTGPACEQPHACCPPDNYPAPQLPAACVNTPGQCDPRPTGM